MPQFSHLHVHTQFSLLDGAAEIGKLFKKAVDDQMPALAITDHGNMFGVFSFVSEALKHKNQDGSLKVKPIIGCEFYLVEDRFRKNFNREERDIRYHQLLLAKNETGYKNLVKLCSLGYLEGIYGKYPRIDKSLMLQYHEGLIATTCCIGAEVPRTILKEGIEAGEKAFKWWLDLFGEDYYVELQRHGMPEQDQVNQELLRLADKYGVKVIASNDSHYVDQQDWNAHDILLCINTGEKKSTPTNKEFSDDGPGTRGKRFAFFNDQFYFKKQAEMARLFADLPEALDNTNEIISKTFVPNLKRDILLPNFPLPEGFNDQMAYLRHLTMQGAADRYGSLSAEAEERLSFELDVIERMGFAGYFLIVSDFIKAGRDLGVFIGPGRGSAAGSAVAYCIGITNIDPIRYDLLFERFLNPERASMPDIDTDFDDEGRQRVIDYVVDKYGRNQVAQIITYGSMAARSSIKDVARVLDLPLDESNNLAKLVPEKPGIKLNRLLTAPIEGEDGLKEKEGLNSDELETTKKLRSILEDKDTLHAQVLREAMILEGSVRNTGVHAAGIIIAPTDLTDLIPVATAKDSDLMVTQFEGSVIEDAGVIKMDFLGLRTLTIIRDALELIYINHGVQINIDQIPLDDPLTFALYQKAETNATFQFESEGMKKNLRELKPDKFEDLIAMNALYRPGPMEYIPNYIRRKHGFESVSYDLPEMEEYLSETYGITVYQEQVMLLSQKLAGFTKGEADKLRKAMGKKDRKTLDYMKPKFIEGATARGLNDKVLEKIWTDWEAFASYAFNKSHSTCYAYLAFQTAYLKAHYPSEFMASNLTNNLSSMDKITFFMEECRRMGIEVLGPDINESRLKFSVNKKGQIRFGLAAIKGVGENAVESIIIEREKNGPFADVYDFVKRINLRNVNRRAMESLVIAGAFDALQGKNRAAYFHAEQPGKPTFMDALIRFGQLHQEGRGSAANSLFGDMAEEISIPNPPFPDAEPWHQLELLEKEKDLVGIYLSGHPLDEFRLEITGCAELSKINDPAFNQSRTEFRVVGIVTSVLHKMNKSGKPFGVFTVEDFTGNYEFRLFSERYLRMKHLLDKGNLLYLDIKMVKGFRNPEMLEPEIAAMGLLADLKDKYTQMTINIREDNLSGDLVEKLFQTLSENPGRCRIKVNLHSPNEMLNVSLVSSGFKVGVSYELINRIEQLFGSKVILN
jgi:DNA polymerase-3 subunit alpha